ncbi:DNA annealing helicase and endonuclease ZRANB3 isoform X2 [Anguilla anguilla]|uniref:DNA annealing helicase and endonuclease ZRANB3 isoform X2 n=1 Tax=Anguilla anguilla TaxID=7936 RepID=UPI0015B36CF4|nr:DNA annealing helicase and endonuclease ZRANB3 isoform X2 [Anguilla anguilla]
MNIVTQPSLHNAREDEGMSSGSVVGEKEAGPENLQDSQLLGLPVKLRQRLMPFQREGVEFALARNGRCMIADEMGLGKTVQAISVAYLYRKEWPLLIVVPSSLKYPWIEEMEKWIPELSPGDIHLVENKMDVSGISSSKVTILGYGLLTTDAQVLVDALTRQSFRVVVVDESHYLKSRNAARSRILVPLVQRAQRAILLTGTPALGRPEELFMQIDALYPRRFGTWSDYAKKYCNAHYRFFGNRRQWDCRGASHLEELHQRLSEIMIRRLKAQVLTQLPPKIRQRIPFDLPKDGAKEAHASFEEWERLMRRLGSGAGPDANPFGEVMGLVTRMYKQTAIAKAGAVKDYIRMLLENERLKFLVFAHHLAMLQACTEAVIQAKAQYIRIDGSVPSSERMHLVHRFQNDPETRVAILSIQAAGQGLTFTAATHVVFAELYWNPGHVKQAEDRAHRIGQTSSVHVHYLIAKGTFDTIMWGMLNRKETVTGSTLNGRKEYLKADLGDKEKWDFLNFAQAWTPGEALVREACGDHDEVFFSHFEKDKQHDIRTFFSPNSSKEKMKRRRTEGEGSPLPISEMGEEHGDVEVKKREGQSPGGDRSPGPDGPEEDEDFAPLNKKIRVASPQLPAGRKRRSWAGKASPASLLASRRLSVGGRTPPANVGKGWSCGACTYANSTLLPYCEMCATPRPDKAGSGGSSGGPGTGRPPAPASPCVAISSSDEEPDPGPPATPALPARPAIAPGPGASESEAEGGAKPEKDGCEGKDSPGGESAPSHSQADESVCDPAHSSLPLYEGLRFCASCNSDRIYLYTKEGSPLNCNFIPMDIKLDSWEDLPEAFQRRENRRQVLQFVREWSSLTSTKQRVVRRSGRQFCSPILALNDITGNQRRQSITKRFLTKEDVAQASLDRAQKDGGSVRTVATETFFAKRTPAKMADSVPDSGEEKDSGCSEEPGYLQALDSEGNPLCLSCQAPCGPGSATWDGRFCGRGCQEEFQVRSSQAYMRARVLEAEQGVCQGCGLNAHQLYQSVRDAPPASRKELLENTWLSQLSLKQLNEMIRTPVEGQFWQVDHIRPVYSGGGQCSLDNLQTLCTVCHRQRTSHQAKERSQIRKGVAASKVASDITRFFIRK